MRSFIAHLSVFLFATVSLPAQPYATVREYESAIRQQFEKDSGLLPDSVKESIHGNIEELFSSALLLPDAFAYPFDSLKKVGRIISRDNKIRVFTWELIRSDGSHHYYGFVLCRRLDPENSLLIRLKNNTANTDDPGLQVLSPENWFGALYYEIIECKWNDSPVYTLLGYDPNNIFTSRKIIDCFYLKDGSVPVFGAPIFMMNNKVRNRVVFEYSARVSMSLRYDEKQKRIVFDHLSPAKPSYEGNYAYYGPDFSYDEFKWINNFWVLTENIDIRNQE
jgi:hypothetical protein